MYKLLIIALLTTLLNAENENPKPYKSLGNVLYNNYEKIANMTNVDAFKVYTKVINDYLSDIIATKEMGFSLEMREPGVSRKDYLDTLRALSKKNDEFLRTIESTYRTSIKNEENEIFLQIVNNALINTESNKHEIISYYLEHSEDINSSGVIEKLIKNNDRIRADKEAQKKRYKTKKMLQQERIKRIRLDDKVAKEKLENRLENDLEKKRHEIRDNQKKELGV